VSGRKIKNERKKSGKEKGIVRGKRWSRSKDAVVKGKEQALINLPGNSRERT